MKIKNIKEINYSGKIYTPQVKDNGNYYLGKYPILSKNCQNISATEAKTLLTRAGANTKIVLTGDYSQIDSPFLSPDSNGLVYCVEKFKDQKIAAHISFSKCERSELAEISSKIL